MASGSVFGPLGAESQTSTTLVPGASAFYGQLSGNLSSLYGGLAGGYGSLLNAAQGQTNRFGSTQSQQIANQYAQQNAQQQQSLQNRGLGNTTVMNAVQQGLTQSQALAQNDLQERVNQQRLGVLSQFGFPVYQALGQNAMAQQQLGQQYMNMLPRTTQTNASQSGWRDPFGGAYGGGYGGLRGGAMGGGGMTPLSSEGPMGGGGATLSASLNPSAYTGRNDPLFPGYGIASSGPRNGWTGELQVNQGQGQVASGALQSLSSSLGGGLGGALMGALLGAGPNTYGGGYAGMNIGDAYTTDAGGE